MYSVCEMCSCTVYYTVQDYIVKITVCGMQYELESCSVQQGWKNLKQFLKNAIFVCFNVLAQCAVE